ncbi:MAG: hypothetical protein KatS3mg110_3527 [Pirellulaceae bacterium]|nr:MAG: hypothetical protein KatS3mg110_3527 [Pirellulaceae bacterium]
MIVPTQPGDGVVQPKYPASRFRTFLFWTVLGAVTVLAVGLSLLAWLITYYSHVATLHGDPTRPGFGTHAQFAFDLSNSIIDPREILPGGPPKDGIPALSAPKFCPADEATFLDGDSRIIGVQFNGEARAYPLFILNYHEIVNDTVGNQPVAVTYCPLCDSAVVFDRRTPLGEPQFGVSGLLYSSNLLMYDRGGNPESLWSQMMAKGVSGPGAQQSLVALPVELTTWDSWRRRYPNTLVLTPNTGFDRPYQHNPYAAYFASDQLMFPVRKWDLRLPAKTPVLGVWTQETARAYVPQKFAKNEQITDSLNGKKITIRQDDPSRTLRVVHADPGVFWMYCFWFAWSAFHPDTSIYGE